MRRKSTASNVLTYFCCTQQLVDSTLSFKLDATKIETNISFFETHNTTINLRKLEDFTDLKLEEQTVDNFILHKTMSDKVIMLIVIAFLFGLLLIFVACYCKSQTRTLTDLQDQIHLMRIQNNSK